MTSRATGPIGPHVPASVRGNGRLDSWKSIADYLNRDVRTVIRWEKERGLPVHRVPGGKGGVFAYRDEIEQWLEGGSWSNLSIAILPFEKNGSVEAYVTEGITDGLIGALSRYPELRVMARSSLIGYAGKPC